MLGMWRRNINQVDIRILRKFFVATVSVSDSIFGGKLLRLRKCTRSNRISLDSHSAIFERLDSLDHLRRDKATS